MLLNQLVLVLGVGTNIFFAIWLYGNVEICKHFILKNAIFLFCLFYGEFGELVTSLISENINKSFCE